MIVVASSPAQFKAPGAPSGPLSRFLADENPQFFPTEVFGSNRAFDARCFSWNLRSMGELPLRAAINIDVSQTFRLLVLPSYRSPVMVRLIISARAPGELIKRIGKNSQRPDILLVDKTMRLEQADISAFEQLLTKVDFWSMPTQKSGGVAELGGILFMFEGEQGQRYHLVTMTTPLARPYDELVHFFLQDLAQIDWNSLPRQPNFP